MKKLLGIIVLGLLLSGNAYAIEDEIKKKFKQAGGVDGDPNKNIILESTNDYIVIRNTAASTAVEITIGDDPKMEVTINSRTFTNEAKNHCQKNSKFRDIGHVDEFDDHTVFFVCTQDFNSIYDDNKSTIYKLCSDNEINSKFYKSLKCKKETKRFEKKYPNAKNDFDNLKKRLDKFKDFSFLFELKKRALAKKEESKKIEMMVMIDEAKATCKLIGIKEETQQFSDCALKLYIKSIDNVAQEKQTIVHTQVNTTSGNSSSGNNSMTIYDPVRDNNALIKRGQGLLTGSCTVANLSNC